MLIVFSQQLMSHDQNYNYLVRIDQRKNIILFFPIGTTCMYVASKYEEMYPPALDEFSFITDNTYETKHILRMEQIIMKVS
jgi:hypothetical protein